MTKALDRVLLWNHYVMPMWHVPYERAARWDRFGRPDKLPDYVDRLPDYLVVGRGEGAEARARHEIGTARPGDRLSALSARYAAAAVAEPRHGLSVFGDLKYPPDFKHFDYVNPDAPKGGRIATIGTCGDATFDSFNGFILKGDAAQGWSSCSTRSWRAP